LGLVLVFAGSAQAAALTVTDVGITGYDYTVGIENPSTGQYEDAYDAAIIFTIDGRQVLVNCDDLWHNIDIGPKTLTYDVEPFSSLSLATNPSGGSYSFTQIAEMSWLLDESDLIWAGTGAPATVEEYLAALQLASWEISNPTMIYTPSSSAVAGLAATYETDAMGQGPLPGMMVEQLLSLDGIQSQLLIPATLPEPSSLPMLLMGLGWMGCAFCFGRKKSDGQLTIQC